MSKPVTLADLPVKTFLKFLREEIKKHAEKTQDRSNTAIVTSVIFLNAIIDTFNSISDSDDNNNK